MWLFKMAANLFFAHLYFFVLDNRGILLFALENPDFAGNFVWLSDDRIAFDVDAAWEFVRIFLTEDYQRNTALSWLFPVIVDILYGA